MKWIFYFLLLFPFSRSQAQRTEFSMSDLIDFTNYPESKFENALKRKGFKQTHPKENTGLQSDASFRKVSKDKKTEKLMKRFHTDKTDRLIFQTSAETEFAKLKDQLKRKNFICEENVTGTPNSLLLFQKANITVQPEEEKKNDTTFYSFIIERQWLPRARDIVAAEDLLQLNSHENIATVFGSSNVKKDIFYFSEKEVNKCSVLFPNTSLQVIFIWNDEINNRGISFLIIGGSLRAQSSLSYYKPIELNKWKTKQGVYSGMTLKDLYDLNGEHMNFYGWESDKSGLIIKNNSGNVDFSHLGVQLNCFDCNEDSYYTQTNVINSAEVMKDNRRIYISTLVILPDKKEK